MFKLKFLLKLRWLSKKAKAFETHSTSPFPLVTPNIDSNDDTSDYYLFSFFVVKISREVEEKKIFFRMYSHDCHCQFKDQLDDFNNIEEKRKYKEESDTATKVY